jgi:hypothetical protein
MNSRIASYLQDINSKNVPSNNKTSVCWYKCQCICWNLPVYIQKKIGHDEQGLRKIWISLQLPRLIRSSCASSKTRDIPLHSDYFKENSVNHIPDSIRVAHSGECQDTKQGQEIKHKNKGNCGKLLSLGIHSQGTLHQYTKSFHECITSD